MNHLKTFYISTGTAQKSHSNMKKKTCYKFTCWVSGNSSHNTTVQDSFDWLSMGLSLVLCEGFRTVLCLAKKRESSLILRNIRTRYFGVIYVTVLGKCILHENLSKIINFLLWKSTQLNWSVLILFILKLWMEDALHLSKWKKSWLH